MYYFLALVLKEDILSGQFWPSYVLCKSAVTSKARTGLRVVRQVAGDPARNTPKLLVTELYGHDDLINFFSIYQTNDKKIGHYHPEGALCWFSCNQYGEPSGLVYYVREVPVKSLMWDFAMKRKYRMEALEHEKSWSEVLSEDLKSENMPWTEKKIYLYQKPNEPIKVKGKKKYGSYKGKASGNGKPV